ncbi:MAG: cytochrome C [Anaerolineaceae bacterium]|nr:cytochrome C [Anaerolineaceae bacterium]
MKRRDWRFLRGFVLFSLLAFGLLQLWPRNHTNPPIVSVPNWDNAQTAEMVQRACFDCHSNETHWPWYTDIVPVSSLLEHDVEAGREVLNFSDWETSCCTDEQIERMAAIVGRDQMPPPYYVLLHPEARLTSEERGKLIYGLIATMENELDEE